MRQGWARNALVYLLILVALVALFYNLVTPPDPMTTEDINYVVNQVRARNVEGIMVRGDELIVTLKNEKDIRSLKEPNVGLPAFFRSWG